MRGEREGRVIAERIPPARDREGALIPNNGLLMLPEPSPGDLFFDIEGDPFFGSDEVDGIDYLFGVIEPGRAGPDGQPAFRAFWSMEGGTVTTAGERAAFEAFIDLVTDRLRSDPNLHVYHYARTSRRRSSGSQAATAPARRRSTGCCGAVSSSISIARCGRESVRPSRAIRSSGSNRSAASSGRSTCGTLGRASSSSRPGSSWARETSATTCSRRSRATTATIASRRCGCGTGWRSSARRSPRSSATCRVRPYPNRSRSRTARRNRRSTNSSWPLPPGCLAMRATGAPTNMGAGCWRGF